MRKVECEMSLSLREEAMLMLLEQVYLAFIYILFFELVIVTAVVISLSVALVVAIRKLHSKKTHLCLVIRDVFYY